MHQLVLEAVPDDLLERLRAQAAKHNRSLEAEHLAVLNERLEEVDASREARRQYWARLRTLRDETAGRSFVPSWVLIREDRDNR